MALQERMAILLHTYKPMRPDDIDLDQSPSNQLELNVRTHKRLASVTSDGGFAYVQFGCGHVACKREDDRIV
jgi:hypothetical protein